MSINPIAVSLGLPIAAGALGSGLKMAQQSFHKILSAVESSQQPAVESSTAKDSLSSTTERLENIARGLRDWLQQHGVRLPYTISVSDQTAEQPQVAIEGAERGRIADLFRTEPQFIDRIRELLHTESSATPFAFGGKKATITDLTSSLE